MNSKIIQNPQLLSNKTNNKKSYKNPEALVKKSILAINITSAKKEDILEYILIHFENSQENYYITTPNPEMVVYSATHPGFRDILNKSKIALCDGIGLLWASIVLGNPLQERFTGVDAMEKLCEKAANRPITVGFLGGKPGVAEKTADCLIKKYPGLKVAYASDVWDESKIGKTTFPLGREAGKEDERNKKTTSYKHLPPIAIDILFVALGFPKQEEWMASHLDKVPVKVMMGVGGAFDYVSGNVQRAPYWVQKIGMEWLYRLVHEPWRIRRQLALPVFVGMVLREKFSPSLSFRA